MELGPFLSPGGGESAEGLEVLPSPGSGSGLPRSTAPTSIPEPSPHPLLCPGGKCLSSLRSHQHPGQALGGQGPSQEQSIQASRRVSAGSWWVWGFGWGAKRWLRSKQWTGGVKEAYHFGFLHFFKKRKSPHALVHIALQLIFRVENEIAFHTQSTNPHLLTHTVENYTLRQVTVSDIHMHTHLCMYLCTSHIHGHGRRGMGLTCTQTTTALMCVQEFISPAFVYPVTRI